jgi:hypothetical protein
MGDNIYTMEGQDLGVSREKAGRYTIRSKDQTWEVWRGQNRRWVGECPEAPEKMVDAPTLQVAKRDIRKGGHYRSHGGGRQLNIGDRIEVEHGPGNWLSATVRGIENDDEYRRLILVYSLDLSPDSECWMMNKRWRRSRRLGGT